MVEGDIGPEEPESKTAVTDTLISFPIFLKTEIQRKKISLRGKTDQNWGLWVKDSSVSCWKWSLILKMGQYDDFHQFGGLFPGARFYSRCFPSFPAGGGGVDFVNVNGICCKLAGKEGTVGTACCPHRVIKASLPVGAAACVDQSDSHLLELIHYSWDLQTRHNLLVFPPAMGLCCEALHVSLWSVSGSGSEAEVIFSSCAYKCSIFLMFVLFCPVCSLLFPPFFAHTSHVPP